MILLLNEWDKAHRYADSFDSFNKFLNKLLENENYKYVDLVELGIEHSIDKPQLYLDGEDLRFYATEKLFKNTLPEIVLSDHIPILEVSVLSEALDAFSSDRKFYLKMLLNSFSQVTVFCGSKYEFEHFSENSLVFKDQILYDAETSFFTDVMKEIEEKKKKNDVSFERTLAFLDGFGFYLSTSNVDADRPKKVEHLSGNIGTKISFDEFLQWLFENRKELLSNLRKRLPEDSKDSAVGHEAVLEYLSEIQFAFVRKHHPIELFLKK